METSTDPRDQKAHDTPEIIAEGLNRRGHVVTSWEKLGQVWMEETGIETTQYRIGLPTEDSSPTVFKVYFPPNCRVEAHTHPCDYSEIILQGSQKVSGKWLHEGDIRIGLANRGYGPLIAGDEGTDGTLVNIALALFEAGIELDPAEMPAFTELSYHDAYGTFPVILRNL